LWHQGLGRAHREGVGPEESFQKESERFRQAVYWGLSQALECLERWDLEEWCLELGCLRVTN
jgi:hypothetical protein